MVEKSNTEEVLDYFFTHPTTTTYVRELARETRRSTTAILAAIKALEKEGLVVVRRQKHLTTISANAREPRFRQLKRVRNLESLYTAGLVDAVERAYRPAAIVLFGSYSRGDDTERSDIDIAIIDGQEADIPLDTYRRKLQREISIHPLKSGMKGTLMENLKNGIVLAGAI